MENKDSILEKSEEPEECKINDSNKDLDGDLYLFLPKNVVDEISEKQSENVPKKPHKNSDKKKKPEIITKSDFSNGGDGEIRTLEELLTPTRFPIVRARPTTRHLRVLLKISSVDLSARIL